MEVFRDHRSMSGVVYEFPDDKLESEMKRYEEKYKTLEKPYLDYEHNLRTLGDNINIFKKVKEERYLKKLKEDFVLKKEHLLILSELNFRGDYLEVDTKRPLGYSDHFEGYCELMKLDRRNISDNEESKICQEYEKLIKELPFAVEFLAIEKAKDILQ